MSNMTKAIAVLGVVAGLGVAALPLSSYAEGGTTVEWGAKAENSDAWTNGTMGGTNETALGEDSFVSTDTTIQLSIKDKLSIATSMNDVELTFNDTDSIFTASPMSVTVVTKNSGGYKLTMVGSAKGATDNNPAAITDLTNEKGDKIETGDLTGTESSWGYKVATNILGTEVAAPDTWTAVANSAANGVIMQSTNPTTDSGDVANVTFGAKTAASQASGTYKGRVTFTATNQAKAGN